MEQQTNRPHRPVKEKKKHEKGQKNVKAFAVANPGRLHRQAVRSSDVKERRLHVPLVDRLPEEAPPIVVAVVGPPGVGKTTLIKSLIKRYTKQGLSHPIGPLTVVTSKRRRLTFMECPSDHLSAMIDVAKIADIVLLMIDGNFGFEMETMEFLNALSASGMPGNVFGILTHLDLFKKQSTLRMAKKRLKHRFWSELYQGAKLFFLSGVINGRYPDREIHNLSRFLSVMKNPRPLIWRNSHPYCLADRFLDITPPAQVEENAKCDRQVALYGYLRGTNFPATNARVHVPGVGDLTVKEIESLPDPCPTPFLDQAIAKASGKASRRRLGEKQKVLFAPMSDVGGVLVDKDAVYIEIKSNTFDKDAEYKEDRGIGEQLMLSLQNERKMLGEGDAGVRLFRRGAAINGKDDENDLGRQGKRSGRFVERDDEGLDIEARDDDEGFESGSEDDEDASDDEMNLVEPSGMPGFAAKSNRKKSTGEEHLFFADSDSDIGSVSSVGDQELEEASNFDSDDEEDDGGLRWKERIAENAKKFHTHKVAYRAADLSRMMYDLTLSPSEVVAKWSGADQPQAGVEEDEDEDAFFKKTDIEKQEDLEDRMTPQYDYEELSRKWQDEDLLNEIRRRFVRAPLATGANATGEDDDEDAEEDELAESDEGDGDFEDLEAGAEPNAVESASEEPDLEAERAKNAKRKEELKLRFEEEDREGFANTKNDARPPPDEFGEDEWYDAQKAALQKQVDINRAEFDILDPQSRARAEGYKAGTYARIVLENVPYEFCRSFNPKFPVIVGGLAPTEDRFGFVQVRIKRHRWHKKILKTNDPLIFSLGWRRFQSLPIYSIHENRMRHRMLKYTPEHMHCTGTFYGPLVAPNTGFCAVQSFSNANKGFRIAATGVVLDADENTEIVKKLKLTGHPYKIFRNTAFIRDMFSSAIEIAKFEGASIKTVSGIRGQIKRALAKPEGHYRATFEDKILMSDIVFLRAWYPVKPHRFYNPVTDLLDAPSTDSDVNVNGEAGWKAMRLTGAIRASLNVPTPSAPDSRYIKIERPTRHFNPLRVPRALAADLPFKSQIVAPKARKEPTYLQKRAVVLGGEEKRARDLLQKLATIRREKVEKRAVKKEEGRQKYRAKVEKSLELKAEREKRERDDYWRKEGRKRRGDAEGGGGGKRQRR
jgi:ribosome biogenesis protein BMS1